MAPESVGKLRFKGLKFSFECEEFEITAIDDQQINEFKRSIEMLGQTIREIQQKLSEISSADKK